MRKWLNNVAMTEKKNPDERIANIAPFGLRMPPDLKERVQKSAQKNNRSMNSEIIALLEHALAYYESVDGWKFGDVIGAHEYQDFLRADDGAALAGDLEVSRKRSSVVSPFEKLTRDIEDIKNFLDGLRQADSHTRSPQANKSEEEDLMRALADRLGFEVRSKDRH